MGSPTEVNKNWVIKQQLMDKVDLLIEISKGSAEFRESMMDRSDKLLTDVNSLVKELNVEE